MLIARIQYNWHQEAGSCISTPVWGYYNFFYFYNPVEIRVQGELIQTQPNACIISRPMESRWFNFREDSTMNWIHNDASIAPLIEKYRLPVGEVFYPCNPSFIPDLFRKIRSEFYSQNPYREELLDGYMEELLIKLSRSIREEELGHTIGGVEGRRMRDLRFQMLSHPEKNWTVEDMAKQVSLSPSRYHALYKKLFGSSPMKDVINAKIDMAKTILLSDETTTLPVVAQRLGYKNQYHFIRQFKAVTGLTPGAYRKTIVE